LLYRRGERALTVGNHSSDELDDLFNTFGSAGIEVIDSDQKYLRDDKVIDSYGRGREELELDLTPGALDKTNDPVRMYLREMGTVPLLTREGKSRSPAGSSVESSPSSSRSRARRWSQESHPARRSPSRR